MADQYPYSMSYKPKPVNAFMSAFASSMEKLLMYKYQQTLQDDSAAKRLTMERQYQEERQKQTEAALSRTPEYQRKQQDLAAFGALPAEKQQEVREIDWGLRAKPKEKDKWDLYLESLIPGAKTGDAVAAPVDPDIANMTARHVVAGKIGEPAAKVQFPPSEQETMWGTADAERKTVEEDIKAQTLEGNKSDRAKAADIKLIKLAGLAKTDEEAEAVWAAKKGEAFSPKEKAAANPNADAMFMQAFDAENPDATPKERYAALSAEQERRTLTELKGRDELMGERDYPAGFVDEDGVPLFANRKREVRRGIMVGDSIPNMKPTAEMVKTEGKQNALIGLLAGIKKDYKDEYSGRVSGNIDKAIEWGTGNLPKEQIRMYRNLRSLKNAELYTSSGMQINESEMKRLIATLPNETDPPPVFKERLAAYEAELQTYIEGRNKVRRGIHPTGTGVEPPPVVNVQDAIKAQEAARAEARRLLDEARKARGVR